MELSVHGRLFAYNSWTSRYMCSCITIGTTLVFACLEYITSLVYNYAMKWIVYVASCIAAFLNFGLLFTFGTLFTHILDYYSDDRAITAAVLSVFIGTGTSFGVVSGLLTKKFGTPRVCAVGSILVPLGCVVSYFAKNVLMLLIFVGILSGVGVCFVFVCCTDVVGRLFKERRREVGIAFYNCSTGIGLVGYPYVLEALVTEYGIRGTFLIIGGILLNNCAYALLILVYVNSDTSSRIDTEIGSNELPNTTHIMCSSSAHKTSPSFITKCRTLVCTIQKQTVHLFDVRYLLVVIASGLLLAASNGILTVLLDLLKWKGLSYQTALTGLIALSIGTAVGRAMSIFFSKIRQISNPVILLTLSAICGLIGNSLMAWFTDADSIITGCVLIGASIGGIFSGATVAVARFVDAETFSVAFGVFLSILGILNIVKGTLFGYIRDTTQSYAGVTIWAVTMHGVGVIMFIVAGCTKSDARTNQLQSYGTTDVSK